MTGDPGNPPINPGNPTNQMTLRKMAELLTPEDFAKMQELRAHLYIVSNQDKLFKLYEKYLNKLLGNPPGTHIVETDCGKCRARVLLRIKEVIQIRKDGTV